MNAGLNTTLLSSGGPPVLGRDPSQAPVLTSYLSKRQSTRAKSYAVNSFRPSAARILTSWV
jgi:hypothetical protein